MVALEDGPTMETGNVGDTANVSGCGQELALDTLAAQAAQAQLAADQRQQNRTQQDDAQQERF